MTIKRPVRKAVFPVAGLGTRFLPATKSIPKEIMTLVDRPLIDYAVEEARMAGIEEFIFVTSRGKAALSDYFDNAPILEAKLEVAGKTDLLEILKATTIPGGKISYVRQNQPLGLGHAVACAAHLIGDEPFAVVLPDDVIKADPGALAQMVDAYQVTGGCMIAAMEVPGPEISSYGVIDIQDELRPFDDRLTPAKGLVEKPKPADAPSNLAVIGRYILTPSVLKTLGNTQPGAGGEIQLTDAIAEELRTGRSVYGYRFEGERFDCGSKLGYLQATTAFALERADLGEGFRNYITRQIAQGVAAE